MFVIERVCVYNVCVSGCGCRKRVSEDEIERKPQIIAKKLHTQFVHMPQ